MKKRFHAMGIKQLIQPELMQKTAMMLLAGMNAQEIRHALYELLAEQKKGKESQVHLINNLMHTWVTPEPVLIPLRNVALDLLRQQPAMATAIHWSMISATYPFWFQIARHTGRLLALQNMVTAAQIQTRIKEQYGDRSSVHRNGRYVIRSFVAWGVLQDTRRKGHYVPAEPICVAEPELIGLMLEAALHTSPDSGGMLEVLLTNPAFFPFRLPIITGHAISRHNCRLDVIRCGAKDELLKLNICRA